MIICCKNILLKTKNDNNFMKQSSRSVSTFRYENKLNENKSFSRLQNIKSGS